MCCSRPRFIRVYVYQRAGGVYIAAEVVNGVAEVMSGTLG